MSTLVLRQEVNIEWSKVDRCDRLVGKVMAAAPCIIAPCPLALDANLAEITAGLAWHYKQYEREQSREIASAIPLRKTMRARRAGLMMDPAPMPPWVFRKP